MQNTYIVPCAWTMYGSMEVEAESPEQAAEIARDGATPLPDNGSYVEDSFDVDTNLITPVFYDCTICGHCHPWTWTGDCRDDDNRHRHDDLPDNAEIRSMGERLLADGFYSSHEEMLADDPDYPGRE